MLDALWSAAEAFASAAEKWTISFLVTCSRSLGASWP